MMGNILPYLKKNRLIQGLYRKASFYAFSRTLTQVAPLAARPGRGAGVRLNLVVPTVRRAHVFGGVATALRFFTGLASRLGDVRCRIILTEYAPAPDDLAAFPGYRLVSWDDDSDHPLQMVTCISREGRTLPVGRDEIFVATQWTTAFIAQRLVAAQGTLHDVTPPPLVYLIQDFEPGFHPWSTDYLLAESTYLSDLPQIAVFNSSPLRDYFGTAGYRFAREYVFEPVLNPVLREGRKTLTAAGKERIILVYGRPSTPRNAFPLIVAALRVWARGEPPARWRLVSLGEDHPAVDLGNGHRLESGGKLSLEEYADLLRRSAVGVSLMISPHPSYPPLEMAHFGLLTVTNRFGGKDLSRWHDNFVNAPSATPEGVASALEAACRRFDADPAAGCSGRSHIPSYTEGGEEFPFLGDLVRELRR